MNLENGEYLFANFNMFKVSIKLDTVGTAYQLVIYMQSNKIHRVIFNY